MESNEPQGVEKLKAKLRAEPLVPIGCLVTAGVLIAGIASFRAGNKKLSQKMMRARVGAQFATMVAIGYGAYYSAIDRKDFDDSTYQGNLVEPSNAKSP